MANSKIHNVRFYNTEVKACYCMAFNNTNKKLALSRSDASIEIWNLNNIPFIERTIASSSDNFSIEGLAWCDQRLFSVGLHGLMVEYDLFQLRIKNKTVATGGAVFCLDINKAQNQIAIGTEEGYLNVFDINEDEVQFNKFFDKQEGRILCLKFDHSGQYIVSGSLDAIRIWNMNTGHAIHKMSTSRVEVNKPTIIWCLAITKDFTIISGDSRGKLTFWDGKVGSQIESYQSHRADILAICLSECDDALYCAGVDPTIIHYVSIKVKNGLNKWVKSIQRKVHTHDVRALILHGEKLYSSGVDGFLTCSYHPPKTVIKYPPFLQNPCVYVCNKARLIMLRYHNYVEVWSLGLSESTNKKHALLPLIKEPKKLLLLQKITKREEEIKEGIICSTMSSDGKWILFSTKVNMRLLKFKYEDDKVSLMSLELMENKKSPCINAVFTTNGLLIIAPVVGELQIFNLNSEIPTILQTIDTKQTLTDSITFLNVSECGKYLVAGDPQSNIVIWTLQKNKYNFYNKLPKYTAAPTAISINSHSLNLIVSYSDNEIIEYEIKSKRLSEFSRLLSKNNLRKNSVPYTIRSITFHPKLKHLIILHDDNSIIVINKEKDTSTCNTKIPRLDLSQSVAENNRSIVESSFHTIKKYKHLVHLGWCSDNEMVAVEVNPLKLLQQLPPCLLQPTFGRK